MASKLSQALSGMASPGIARLRGAGSGMQVKAAQVPVNPEYESKSQLIGTLGKFAQMGADAAMKWKENQKSKADERSNEIIRSLTPEQRRQAIKDGVLMYQDDPDAMEALNVKTGRNAAFLIDDEVAQKIQQGNFRTREEMEQFRHNALQEGMRKYADQYGIDIGNEAFQRGFNADITDRNIALYGSHDKYISDQTQKGAILNTKVELNSALNDPAVLRSGRAGEFFEAYFQNGLVTGSIPSDDAAAGMISTALGDVTSREGGTAFLQSVENRKVSLYGKETTFRDLLGKEQWDNLMVKAQATEFKNNAKLTESFRLDINNALNQENLTVGWEQLQGIKAKLDAIQPGEEMTPQREWLISAQEQMQNRFNQESKALAAATDKEKKTLNKQRALDGLYDRRINGEYISLDPNDIPSNEDTGKYERSDLINFANKKLLEIDSMQVPDNVKDDLKLKYLRADPKDGPFRTAVGVMVQDAANEWSSSVINGEMKETPAMDNLRRIRNTDPDLVAALYPEQAELFLTLDQLDSQGINPQMLIDADRKRSRMTKDMQYEDDRAWASLKNNSESPELSRIPASLDSMARKIYDAVSYRTGNADMAMQQVDKFLKDSTVTFKGDDVDGDTIGILPKNMLQVSDDPKSWEQGRDILDEARKGIIAKNPWVTNKQLSVFQQGDSIYLTDTTGEINYRYDKDMLAKVYRDNQQKLQAKAEKEALAEANKRAPIAAATKAREEAGKRVRAKKKAVPKFIYGGGDNQ